MKKNLLEQSVNEKANEVRTSNGAKHNKQTSAAQVVAAIQRESADEPKTERRRSTLLQIFDAAKAARIVTCENYAPMQSALTLASQAADEITRLLAIRAVTAIQTAAENAPERDESGNVIKDAHTQKAKAATAAHLAAEYLQSGLKTATSVGGSIIESDTLQGINIRALYAQIVDACRTSLLYKEQADEAAKAAEFDRRAAALAEELGAPYEKMRKAVERSSDSAIRDLYAMFAN